VPDSFARQMKRRPAAMRKTMTCDRGTGRACDPKLARRLKIDIRFCDAHAPGQRGANETTNGRLRLFMPGEHPREPWPKTSQAFTSGVALEA
jgi:transposase, IS30 family